MSFTYACRTGVTADPTTPQVGGCRQRDGPQKERRAPSPAIGHYASGYFEEDHAGCEESIGGEGLKVTQPGVQQEQGIDAPDERRRNRIAERQCEVDALDFAGVLVQGVAGPAGAWRGHVPILAPFASLRQIRLQSAFGR
ncbi:hypothetical protein CVCC1112_3570 [Paenarthrobacter nicotinovorans]|nr:hypothetical protein CVCC1112_3570 [Paenarthrobacter nicotinovorans]